MDAIAFRTIEGPGLVAPTHPNHCALWVWRTELFPTVDSGLNLDVSTRQGYIVQQVRQERVVTRCDDTPDEGSSDDGVGWEYWDLTRAQPWTDLIAQPFLKARRTRIRVTLRAAYLRAIAGASLHPVQDNPQGTHGTVSGEPRGFAWTLERHFVFDFDCCGDEPRFSWYLSALNSFDSYREQWSQEGAGRPEMPPEHAKEVDGEPVE